MSITWLSSLPSCYPAWLWQKEGWWCFIWLNSNISNLSEATYESVGWLNLKRCRSGWGRTWAQFCVVPQLWTDKGRVWVLSWDIQVWNISWGVPFFRLLDLVTLLGIIFGICLYSGIYLYIDWLCTQLGYQLQHSVECYMAACGLFC